ncbi:unnamed protein product [Notodromas monacha]|uniref:SAM domain-containing protein n=1 Tax=Notodromas monacha TaxID=399045 RepID=A0A7R9BL43_9CRUS|nr:unnamed protein product [Notodromas monacha]CAG0917487.1 unnamed protein product [Notodromas monacha]
MLQDLFGLKDSEVKALGVRNVDDRNKILSSLRNLQERRKKVVTFGRYTETCFAIVATVCNIPELLG